MALATGIFKRLSYKKESAWGTPAGATGAQVMRRTSSDIGLQKKTYESAEIRSDQQVADFRHGVRSVQGTIAGELSPASYQDFMATLVRKAWAATTPITALSITIAGTGPTYTVTRAAGDFLAGGLKIGDVIRLSAGSFNAANLLKNMIIVNLSATVATVIPANGVAMVAEGPIASSTVTVIGKKTFVPTTGHLDESYTIEHWFQDIAQNEYFTGMKPTSMEINMPSSGMVTASFGFMGKDMTSGTAAYFTTPTAANANPVLSAVTGNLLVGGTSIATLTSAKFTLESGMTEAEVVGSNSLAAVFAGRVRVSGEVTAFFENASLRDLFTNETPAAIQMVLTSSSSGVADFISFIMSNCKFGSASKNDGEAGLIQTLSFTALYNGAGGTALANDATTISIQDSLAA